MMGACRHCGEGVDEDGYSSCDCHKPRQPCDLCHNDVVEDSLCEMISFNFQEVVFCDDCEEYFYETQDMWWQNMSEDYHDYLFDIHETVQKLEYEQRFIPSESEIKIGDTDAS